MEDKKSQLTHQYNETIEAYRFMGRKYLDNIALLTPGHFYEFINYLPKGGSVLEIGCAGGRDARKLADAGFLVTGVDTVDIFIDEAKKLVPEGEFQVKSVLELNYTEQFDGVYAMAVLLHLTKEDVPKAISVLHRALKPHGKIFIAVKQGTGTAYVTDKLSDQKRLFTYFSEQEIDELLNNHGFHTIGKWVVPDDAGREDTIWIRIIAEKV